jgi:hypothetical protein
MDQQKLRTLVFEKTGVKIDVDDPVFALVALNEAVLAEAVERHVALLHEANAALAAQVATLQGRASDTASDTAPDTASDTGPDTAAPAPLPTRPPAAAIDQRSIGLALGAAVLGALLVLCGQALLFKPAPASAPVVQARELTPEQDAALRNGAKLSRIVEKLDRKTRNSIEAEMQKP